MGNFDIEAQNFINAIKKMVKQNKPNTMIYGIVKTVDPLSIDIGNGIVLPKEFLFLGQMCRPHKVKIPHTHILDTHFTEMSPSVGSIGAGTIAGTAFEQTQKAIAESTMVTYKTLDENGNEVTNTISKKNLGRSSIQTSIEVGGQATIVDDSVMITDSEHKHIINKQITKDSAPKPFMNKMLFKIFNSEKGWLLNHSYPIGISYLIVLRKRR